MVVGDLLLLRVDQLGAFGRVDILLGVLVARSLRQAQRRGNGTDDVALLEFERRLLPWGIEGFDEVIVRLFVDFASL